jgi:hypothetical protein
VGCNVLGAEAGAEGRGARGLPQQLLAVHRPLHDLPWWVGHSSMVTSGLLPPGAP